MPAMLRRRQWPPRLRLHPRARPMARGGTNRPRARQPMAARRPARDKRCRLRRWDGRQPPPVGLSKITTQGRGWVRGTFTRTLSRAQGSHPGTLAGRREGAQDTPAPFQSGTGQCSWASPLPTCAMRLLCYVTVSELLRGMLLIINIKSNDRRFA